MLLYAALITSFVLTAPSAGKSAPTMTPVRRADLSGLSATDRQHFDQIATDEFCGCSSPLTLAGCLQTRPTCQIAQDVAIILARAIGTHAPHKAVAAFASQAVLGPYCAPPAHFALPGAAHRGVAKARITVVEFADFRCTHCRHAVPKVHAALERFKGQVQLIYAPLVLDEHSPSMEAAEAAMAALAQDKFWPMHAALFAREAGDFDATTLMAAAKTAGLDIKRYQADMASHKHRDTLAGFKKEAIAAGLTGTPLFFVNGRRYEFEPDMFPIEERLQMELDRDVGQCD